jgi:CDP-6-deoxy-D-xylo-4-hexulose-3-dehydrase
VQKATKFEDEYCFAISSAFNVRPLEINSAVQREQLKKLPLYRTARRQNWNTFVEVTKGLPITMQVMEGTANPFGMSFSLNDPAQRSPLVAALRANGVDCRLPTGGSFTKHPIGKPWADQLTPNADRIHRAGLFIGNAPYPIPELIELAVGVMKEVLE